MRERTRSTALLVAMVAAAMVGATAAMPARAEAAAPPPDVVGQPLRTALPALQQWRPNAVFRYVPDPATLPAGTDQAEAGVAKLAVLNDAGQPDPDGQYVELTLAALVPRLIGLDRSAGAALLARHGLVGTFAPRAAPPTYQVAGQRPLPGQLVPFSTRVFTEMLPARPTTAPPVATTPAEPTPGATTAGAVPAEITPPDEWRPAATLVASGVGLLLLLLLALAGLLRWRARRGRPRPAATGYTVMARPGPVTAPVVTDIDPGRGGLSVRLEPHLDHGTQVLLEEGSP